MGLDSMTFNVSLGDFSGGWVLLLGLLARRGRHPAGGFGLFSFALALEPFDNGFHGAVDGFVQFAIGHVFQLMSPSGAAPAMCAHRSLS